MPWDEIRLPERTRLGAATGASTGEIRLTRWLLPDGAALASGQAVCQIETDKAIIDLEAIGRGILQHVLSAGSVLNEGDLLGRIKPLPPPA